MDKSGQPQRLGAALRPLDMTVNCLPRPVGKGLYRIVARERCAAHLHANEPRGVGHEVEARGGRN